MKRISLSLASLLLGCGLVRADIQVVFEHLLTAKDTPLPILKPQPAASQDGERFDGTWTNDSYGGFERYDANRLLLAVRENGLNERNANHDKDLAAKFPDRSLIWIDPQTGAPQGVALVIGLKPVPLDKDFTSAGGTVNDYYFCFSVDEAGVIYTGYKNKLLRYEPDGQGGFKAPTVAYTHQNDGSENWAQWRYETIRATGKGKDTVLIAGGKTWRPSQGYREFRTKDGLTFTETDATDFKGGASRVIPAKGVANEEWIYGTFYPGGSNGVDTKIVRYAREKGGNFARAPFDLRADPDNGYTARFFTDADVHPNFPYLVTYSTPSWNSAAVNVDPAEPGWIAVHDQNFNPEPENPDVDDGKAKLIAKRAIQVTENDEKLGATALWHGTLGKVVINVLPGMRDGQAELLWYSGVYGYGRYILDFAAQPPAAPAPFVVTSIRRVSANEAAVSWKSETGKTYDVEGSPTLAPGSWQALRAGIAGAAGDTSQSFAINPTASQFYVRVKRVN